MTTPTRRALALALGAPVAAFLLAAAAPAYAADDDGAVVHGTWSVDVKVKEHLPNFDTVSGTWTYDFGEACTVGEACRVSSTRDGGSATDTRLTPSAQGFTFTDHAALDCFDTVTGELRTPHGADYDLVGHLNPASTEVRDGVTYVTSMSGTLVETIKITGAGLAANCSTDGQGRTSETQRAVLNGTPLPLPDPPGGTSPDPVGVDPAAAAGTGTLPEFTLPRSDEAARSAEAVADGRRSSVPGALTMPSDALRAAVDRLPVDLLLLAVLGLLMVFPAQIFNSTYEENHERINRARRRLRQRRTSGAASSGAASSGRARRVGLFLLCALVGTVLGGLLDPGFGADQATGALLVGVFAALLVAVLVAAGAAWLFRAVRRHPHNWYLRAIPSALLLAVLCVVVSRLTHFQPGYLYGVLGGAVFVGVLARRTEGRAEAVTLGAWLVLALAAWGVFEPVARAANDADASFPILAADSLLGCLFIGGVEGLLFSLIPLRFLPGYRVRQWGWIPWGLLTLVVTYLFVHVLLVPESGYLGRSTSVSANVTIALFVTFGVASGVFWAWFRFRPDPADQHSPASEPTGDPGVVGAVEPLEAPVAVTS